MTLGGLTTCPLKYILKVPSQIPPSYIHRHVPIRFFAKAKQFKRKPAHLEHTAPRLNTRANPIPSKELSHAESARLLRFLNQDSPDVQSTVPDMRRRRWVFPTDYDVASSYLSLRLSSPLIGKLRTEAYMLITKEAQRNQLQQVMDLLAGDLLTHFPRDSDLEGFAQAAVAILSLATPDCPLTPQRILELYDALTVSIPTQAPPLTPNAWDRVFCAAIAHPESREFSLESLASKLLSANPRTEQANARSTWIAYKLVIQILMQGVELYPEALAVFQQLVQSGRIPRLAQQRAEDQGGSFKTIIASTLVRGCLVYGWYLKASELMLEMLQDSRWSQAQGATVEDLEITAILGLEVLHTLIRSPTKQETQTCHRLIRAFLSIRSTVSVASPSPLHTEIPYADLLAFYEACYHYRLVGDAASVYVHLQSPRIRKHHEYPPPQRSALFWLFDHFADPGISSRVEGKRPAFKGHIHMARNILGDILYRGIPVPVVDRPRFIAVAAARGFAFYARRLWELYTAENDPDRDVVRGNGHMLVPVVKLFRKLQERWDDAVERKLAAAGDQVDKLVDVRTDPTDTLASSSDTILNPSIEHGTAQVTCQPRQSILPDSWRFAERVLDSYIVTKQPFAMASQEDLNALARAHLVLDHIPEGLEALSMVMERGDTPDSKDINVALAAVARYSPRRAERMLEYMIGHGVEPTASAFSAILHAALKDKDVELVERLVNRASAMGYGDLTPKAIVALAQSSISFDSSVDEEERLRQQTNLSAVVEAIKAVLDFPSTQRHRKDHGKDHILSVKMGHKCIEAALATVHPALAHWFWMTLVKDRVVWDDQGSKSIRAAIGRIIRDQCQQGRLGHSQASSMLEDLEEPSVDEPCDKVNNR